MAVRGPEKSKRNENPSPGRGKALPGDRRLIHAGSLNEIINYLIYRNARLLRNKFQRDMRAAGLDMTQEQYFLLFKLWARNGQYQAELSDDFLCDAPNITRILDGMERRRMIKRGSDPSDRRKSRIFLAREGLRARALYRRYVYDARRADYQGLGDEDLRELRRILGTIENNILGKNAPSGTD